MTDNPFDGFDLNALIGQAQQLQEQLTSAQAKLAEVTVEGTVADGTVTVTVNGIGELQRVEVKTGTFDGQDPDSLTDLGDLIVAAYRDARQQAEALAGQSLGPITDGLNRPDLPFKLGF